MPPNDTSPDSFATPTFAAHAATEGRLSELVVCSLEPWNEIWRRNQFFVDALLGRNPELRVLFVEPAADVLHDLSERRVPTLPRFRTLTAYRRLRAFRPLKPLPRRLGHLSDAFLLQQVRSAAKLIGFAEPTLWINDVTYAPLIRTTGWPSVYDVTDDWLLAPFPPHELERLRRLDALALAQADEVIVCSPALGASRGASRAVTLIPNGVDIEHFRRAQPRPNDLPEGPTAVYVGSLHDARIDIDLVVELASALPHVKLVFVGPNSLTAASDRRLAARPNVVLLGPRPYHDVPAYLQHADVVIVPHRISAFTESLDPIKAYECLTIATPTVSTAVAGFREHRGSLNVVDRGAFSARVATLLREPLPRSRSVPPVSWDERALAFESALFRSVERRVSKDVSYRR